MFRSLVALLAGALVAFLVFDRFPRVGRRSVLLVSIETFRADRLGMVRNGASLTPNLDALAARGTRFANAYAAASFTIPSLHTIATGEPPRVHRVQYWTKFGNPYTGPTLAGLLREEGHTTGFVYSTQGPFTAWPILRSGWTDGPIGFDRVDDGPVEAAVAWLDRHAEEPFFLWVHLFHPHTPYAPADEFVDAADLAAYRAAGPPDHVDADHTVEHWVRTVPDGRGPALADALYEADVRAADAAVGRLLADLARRGLLETTVVCVVADHGESLAADAAPRWDHGTSVDEPLVRVPLVFAGPGVPVGVDAGIARHVDLAPTLMRLAGAEPPRAWSGRDLFGGTPPPQFAVCECSTWEAPDAPMYSVTDGSRSLRIFTGFAPWRVRLRDETSRSAPPVEADLASPHASYRGHVEAWNEETEFCLARAPRVNDASMDDRPRDEAQIEVERLSGPYVNGGKRR